MKDIIIEVLNKVSLFLKQRWHGIIAPNETRASKQADVFDKLISTFHKMQNEDRKDIVFHLEMYKELGVSEEECRNKIMNMLEAKSSKMMSTNEFVCLLENLNRTNRE